MTEPEGERSMGLLAAYSLVAGSMLGIGIFIIRYSISITINRRAFDDRSRSVRDHLLRAKLSGL